MLQVTSKPGGEREEVERPLVPVHVLRGLAGLDADDLGEVELERGGMSEHAAHGADHRRVHHQIAGRGSTGDEPAGPSGVLAAEVVPVGSHRHEGRELGLDLIEHRRLDQIVDDDAAVGGQHLADFLDADVRTGGGGPAQGGR